MKLVLIMVAAAVAGSVIMYGAGLTLLSHEASEADAFPAFMNNYKTAASYDDSRRAFSDFVETKFPIGSDENESIASITSGGFEITTSHSKTVELLWKRHAGPCNEWYSIILTGDSLGKIAKIAGQLSPKCL